MDTHTGEAMTPAPDLPPLPEHPEWHTRGIDWCQNEMLTMENYGRSCQAPLLAKLAEREAEIERLNVAVKAFSDDATKLQHDIDKLNVGSYESLWKGRAENAERKSDELTKVYREQVATIDDLRAKLEAAQKDARRYRYMRSNSTFQSRNGPGLYWYLPYRLDVIDKAERLDESIDTALERSVK